MLGMKGLFLNSCVLFFFVCVFDNGGILRRTSGFETQSSDLMLEYVKDHCTVLEGHSYPYSGSYCPYARQQGSSEVCLEVISLHLPLLVLR